MSYSCSAQTYPAGPRDTVPTVSVVLPVFDGERFVAEAVRSIQAQTFEDWELVILDDGSRDGSLALCRELARADPRIRVYESPENRGLGASMARLAELARGRYVAVQEQDDVSLPERLAVEVAALDAELEIGLVSGVAVWIDDDGRPLRRFPGILAAGGQYPQELPAMVRYLYLEQCKVTNAAAMFRRAVLEDPGVGFDPDARMSVDWQFFLHLAHRWRIRGLHQDLVRVRRGRDHASLSRRKELQFREARRCIDLVYRRYRDDPSSPIDARLRRRAHATQRVVEGRYYGSWRGVGKLLEALVYEPTNAAARAGLVDLGRRAASKPFRRTRA